MKGKGSPGSKGSPGAKGAGKGKGKGAGKGKGETTLETSGEDYKIHSKRVGKTLKYTRNECKFSGKGKGKGGKPAAAKVIIEPHRHEGCFVSKGKDEALLTR
jgi:rRNA 2'-O-methyltransferase fibrillarin